MSGASITAEPPPHAAPETSRPSRWRKYALAAGFLAPAFVLLIVWVVYPTIYTIVQSLYGVTGFGNFVGFRQLQDALHDGHLPDRDQEQRDLLAVVPALVTAVGLVFAVLIERISWSVAFKTAVFMPMAISAFAAGITWRIMYEKDPDQAVNAAIKSVKDTVTPSGVLASAAPSTDQLSGSPEQGHELAEPVSPGDGAALGRRAFRRTRYRRAPSRPSSRSPPGRHRRRRLAGLRRAAASRARSRRRSWACRASRWSLLISPGRWSPRPRPRRTAPSASRSSRTASTPSGSVPQLAQPFEGVSWLGERLITPSILIAYIWIWAGFAMVDRAGLAAMPRDVPEAARTDGATEWQVFRRVTIPLLAPVLAVVFITMLINVLKVFDIVIAIAPGSVQDDASVLAVSMWRTSFGGTNNFGLGSAVAVFIFVLVIPILLLNVRRFPREV